VLKTQLDVYRKGNASWSIWLYKDLGFQGMVHVDQDSAYRKLLTPFIDKKKRLVVDAWGSDDTGVKPLFDPLVKWLSENSALDKEYPWGSGQHLSRAVRETLMSKALCDEFASYFKDKSLDELEELAASFKFENCLKRDKLNAILKKDAEKAEMDEWVVIA
jgi:hypothetical protein